MPWPPASSKIIRSPLRLAGAVVAAPKPLRRLIGPIVTSRARVVSRARFGSVTVLTAAGAFTGRVFYHWWVDGNYAGQTASPTLAVHLEASDVARVEVIETLDPDFDPVVNAPAMYGPRRVIRWLRSVDLTAHKYRVEQSRSGAAYTVIGTAYVANRNQWEFEVVTPRLDDLVSYEWRVIPVTLAGNDGAPLGIPAELIVRTPDAPDYTVLYDDITERVTFTAA